MVLILPRLKLSSPITDKDGGPVLELTRAWNNAMTLIEANVNGIQDALDAAGIAQAAAVSAASDAAAAQASADAAAAAGSGSSALQALVNSGVNNACTIGAFDAGSDATVTVSANTRYYGDGTSVAVNSGSVTGVAYGLDAVLIFYDDLTRAGGAVTYQVTIDPTLANPSPVHPNRHYVGSVPTPSALDPPNVGSPKFYAP